MNKIYYGKWLSPKTDFSSLHEILANHIAWALEWTHCWIGSTPLPNDSCDLLKIVVHSYREVGTALEVNVELQYKMFDGESKIIFGRVIL